MRTLAKVLLGLLALLGFAGAVLYLAWDRILDVGVARFAEQVLAEPESLRDGQLHVVLCGTAGPVADAQQRSACNAVIADGEMLLVDVGGGGTQLASGLGLPLRQLSTILVTHLHHDHIGGIPDALHGSWFVGRTRPVTVYGPPGIEEVMRGFGAALAEDRRLRALPGGGALEPRAALASVEVVEVDGEDAVTVLERGRLRVAAFAVDHGPIEPAYGYRVELADRAAVFTGDGRADDAVARHAQGADLLVSATIGFQFLIDEARIQRALDSLELVEEFPDAMRVLTLFSSPREVAAVAQRAGVPRLVYSHRQPIPTGLGWLFLWGVSDVYDGEAAIGEEGMRFAFPTRVGP